MKRIAFNLLVMLLVPALNIAQEKLPQISFDNIIHDFGIIKEEGGTVTTNFEFTNTGNAPLIINRVSSSCGCATPQWPKEPIKPGAKASIQATYDPLNRPGPFNKTITVFSNAAVSGNVLTIRGQVTPKPKTPEDIYRRRFGDMGVANMNISLGKVFSNGVAKDSVSIYNFGSKPLTINFDRPPAHITITAIPLTLKPQEEGFIYVTFDAAKQDDWGFVINRVRIMPNNENHQGNQLSISATIEEDFSNLTKEQLASAPLVSFSETTKDFGEVKEGDVINHEFVFSNNGKSDLIIRKIKASCGCTTAAPKVNVLKPGEKTSMSASFKTAGFTGRQSKTITVITNDPKNPSIVLRLSGTVSKQ